MTCSPEAPEKTGAEPSYAKPSNESWSVEEVLEIKLSETLHESRYHRSKGAMLAKQS